MSARDARRHEAVPPGSASWRLALASTSAEIPQEDHQRSIEIRAAGAKPPAAAPAPTPALRRKPPGPASPAGTTAEAATPAAAAVRASGGLTAVPGRG